MGLIGNYSVLNKTPGRWLGGNSTAHASGVGSAQVQTRANWGNRGSRRNMALQEGLSALELLSIPAGYGGSAILMPIKAGGMSATNSIVGTGNAAASIIGGKNASATLSGSGSLTANGSLVISLAASLSGSGTVSGSDLKAFLGLAASLSGSGAVSQAALKAKGNLTAALSGAGDLDALATALGTLSASITSSGELLTTANVGNAVLDALNGVEDDWTLRQALRIILSALGGKVSISGNTVTFRDVNDTADRITATTDSNGQRTAVTLDAD